jgi:hypothetical protein
MSALKQNPFLVGFGAVMVIGVGALGYLTYSASEAAASAASKYSESEQELNRLQNLKPSPTDAVLKQITEQKAVVTAKRDALRKELAAIKVKEEPVTGPAFQNLLTAAVAQLGAKVEEAGVKLPDGKDKGPFYLGFNVYQTQPPRAAAAPLLLRQLRAIEIVTNLFLETKNVFLNDIVRPELKEEKDAKPVAADPKDKGGKGKDDDDSKKVVTSSHVTFKFTTAQENLQKILNGLVANKQQLFVVRRITIKNEKEDAPPRGVAAAPAFAPPPPPAEPAPAPAPDAPPAPGTPAPAPAVPPADAPPAPAPAPAAAPAAADVAAAPVAPEQAKAASLERVFGNELVKVTLELEIVNVADPEVPAEKPAPSKKEKQP